MVTKNIPVTAHAVIMRHYINITFMITILHPTVNSHITTIFCKLDLHHMELAKFLAVASPSLCGCLLVQQFVSHVLHAH